jgi:hypothetical protein
MTTSRCMAILIWGFAFPCVSAFAQISVTTNDVRSLLTLGNTATERLDGLTTSINIGTPGSTSWDFSMLNSSISRELTSVNPALTPYASQFPGATHALRSTVAATIGGFTLTATQYQYLTLVTSLMNPGTMAGAEIPGVGSGLLGTIHAPFETMLSLPCTMGTAWGSTYVAAFACTVDTQLVLATVMNHSISYVVDAYGPMTLPGGSVRQALRIRKMDIITPVVPAGSPFAVLSYQFIARDGSMVNFTAFDTTQTGDVIQLSGVTTWRSPVLTNVASTAPQPSGFALMQNYPNPFNPSTSITYSLPHSAFVTLTVFNALGEQVAQLVNEQQETGTYQHMWNAEGMASGMYFYKLQAGNYTATQKMILLK